MAANDLMKWCNDNCLVCLISIVFLLHVFDMLNPLLKCFGLEGFENPFTDGSGPLASEPLGQNAGPQAVQDLGRTPTSCYPQKTLKPEDLLPSEDSAAIQEFNSTKPDGEGILSGINLLDSGYHIGSNTIGQSLRNANRQLRSEPPNPQVAVSPWQNSTISPDLPRRPLEVGESCAAA